jgi:hypothetical protein
MIILWIKISSIICLMLASVETLHGIARTIFVVPKIGNKRAKQYSVISGTLLAFAVCYIMVPWLDINVEYQLVLVGLVLSIFMATFDIILARFVVKLKWKSIINDFNPAKGNYLIFGLILLTIIPYAVIKLKGFV